MTRFLTHYELFKLVQDVPGSVVECGVYRGDGLLAWAKLLEIHNPGDRIRKVIGLDNFKGFEHLTEEDGAPKPEHSKMVGGWNGGAYYEELLQHVGLALLLEAEWSMRAAEVPIRIKGPFPSYIFNPSIEADSSSGPASHEIRRSEFASNQCVDG